jgi:subfamily B ATP-binding cassette protein MsbA
LEKVVDTHSYLRNLQILGRYVHDAHISVKRLSLPFVLVLAASTFEAGSIALLIPIFNSALNGNDKLPSGTPEFLNKLIPPGMISSSTGIIIILAMTAFVLVVLKTIFRYAATVSLCGIVRTFSTSLRKRIYARFLSFGKLFFDRHDSGHLYSILSHHVGAVAGAMVALQDSLYVLFTLCAYFGLMLFISWRLTIAVALVFPALHYALRALIRKIEKTSYAHVDAINRLGRKIAGSLAGMPLVKACNNEEQEQQRFSHISDVVAAFVFSMQKKSSLISPVQEVITLGFLLLVIVLMGCLAQTDGGSGLAEYAVFLFILRRAAATFGVINNMKGCLAGMKGSLDQVEMVFDDRDKFFISDGAVYFPGITRSINLAGLSYTYPDGVQALADVNFEINKGARTAVVGSSGAGKSTLVNLLMRFYDPPPGAILVDGTDIRSFTLASWRARLAWVSQDTFLFNETLRSNLLYGLRRDVTAQELDDVIEKACLAELVKALPAGLETEIGERGVKLSGGEKQRVAIARAMLKQAEILIFDEATSALDSITERAIKEALDKLTNGKTAIIIAHRLATVRDADQIVVLENGRVVESGSPAGLVARNGKFAEYWREQKVLL